MSGTGGRTTFRTASIPSRFQPYATSQPRPYKPHLTPAVSSLRPHCRARDRLLLWKPEALVTFPLESEDDRRRIMDVLALGFSEGTLQTYGSALLTFHVFCDSRSIAEVLRAPASRALISLFISSLAGLYSASAISNYVAGLRAWHTINRLDWYANDREVETLIRGATNAAPPRRPSRPPFTLDLLRTVLSHFSTSLPLDCAVAAALTTAFWTSARLGEIVIPAAGAFRADTHLKPSDVRNTADGKGNDITVLHVPKTKCSPQQGEDIYFAPQPGIVDPRSTLERHLQVNAPPVGGHLFAYKSGQKHVALTRHTFLKRIKAAGAVAGVTIPPGHSIRIGSTTEYLLRGVPFDVMRAQGRWASAAFLKYLRKHAEIMAPYIQANPDVQAEFMRVAMPPVR